MQGLAIKDSLLATGNANIEIRPVSDPITRTKSFMEGSADFCICDVDVYYAQEGLLGYDTENSGPSEIRLVLASKTNFAVGLGLSTDIGSKAVSDLRNQPVPWIRKSPQLNAYMTAFLAYGGLTWQDVQQMTYPNFEQARIGYEKGQLSAIIVPLGSSADQQQTAPRRPYQMAKIDPNQKAAWSRLKSAAPYIESSNIFPGIGLTSPYPLLVTSASEDREKVYQLTKLISENLNDLSERVAGGENWHPTWQNFSWILPYHEGAVDYFKELGIWTPQAQIHQEFLVSRQKRLVKSFDDFSKQTPSPKNFAYEWQVYRADALSKPIE